MSYSLRDGKNECAGDTKSDQGISSAYAETELTTCGDANTWPHITPDPGVSSIMQLHGINYAYAEL